MYSFLINAKRREEAAIRPESAYQWFIYKKGKPVDLDFRGRTVSVDKGQRFGVRKSSNGKNIRLIFPKDPTRVFTLSTEQAQRLARGV